ncbi:MAG: helix-turn-helix transcriptional regulator [Saprospiraceae bacterium]
MNKDLTPSQRIVSSLLRLLRYPYRFSRKDFATWYDVDIQTIKRDFDILQSVGLSIDCNHVFRYAVLPEGQAPELKKLQVLTKEELAQVKIGLQKAFAKTSDVEVLKRKLETLYDFQRLGIRALRRPELSKIDALEKCMSAEALANLVDYRSTNANDTSHRLVEPFHLDTANGILHAYDLAKQAVRHFRLDRMSRVEEIEESWQNKAAHIVVPTDPFRIAMAKQERVHLTMGVRAYNDLLERFPAAVVYTLPSGDQDQYDFDGLVNTEFYGLLPFCLANWQGVEIHQPERLRDALRSAARELLEKH